VEKSNILVLSIVFFQESSITLGYVYYTYRVAKKVLLYKPTLKLKGQTNPQETRVPNLYRI
jgi:hypothetical protein